MSYKDFCHNVYSISFKDMMDLWIESFHPFGTVLIIWDAGNHHDILKECGLLVDDTELYNSKALTIELPGTMEAFQVMDTLTADGLTAYMQVYKSGKLISDNI
jgi:hypothetical protein